MDYSELIQTLPLEAISKVNFFDENQNPLDKEATLIKDYGHFLERGGSPFLPVFAAKGFYQELNNLETVNFYFGQGTHILFITVMPISMKDDARYQFSDYSARYYYEDTRYGYLIQICEID